VVSPIRWRFTYLCWNIPIVKADRPDAGAQPRTDMPNIPGQADSQRLLRAGTRCSLPSSQGFGRLPNGGEQIVLMPPVRLAKHPGHHLVEHGERGICQSA
jgi:hypothetical protein